MIPFSRLFVIGVLTLLTLNDNAECNVLGDPSFEDMPIGTQSGFTLVFDSVGEWTIDEYSIRGAENGVSPMHGSQMLRFDGPAGHAGINVYQLVDLSPFGEEIAAQQALADYTAFFNAPAAHDFYIHMLAFEESGLPININDWDDRSSSVSTPITSDSDAATWEQHRLQYLIPENAKFLALGINSVNNGAPSYADQVSLMIRVIEPGDMNGDGLLNLDDVNPFVEALTDRAAYDLRGYGVDADITGDVNGDDAFNLGDVEAFQTLLVPPGAVESVPEPSSLLLLAVAMPVLFSSRGLIGAARVVGRS